MGIISLSWIKFEYTQTGLHLVFRIPLSEKPREKPKCPYHTSHVMEFTCLEADCASAPLMCYICKDYGRHKGHNHNLLELEAEKMRVTMSNACTQLKKFMEDVSETSRRLGKQYFNSS